MFLPDRLVGEGFEFVGHETIVEGCPHVDVVPAAPVSDGCEDCRKLGDEWTHLRVCLQCGYVGCCDDSKNTHATKHHESTGHPAIASLEPGETWRYCYVDEVLATGVADAGHSAEAPPP
jgi:CPA2 family monovalent cation:H+ antiporter-2